MQAIAETVRPTRGEAITKVLEIVAVLGATIFVIWQLRPDLLFGPSMDVGGDNAGHVVTPYFLIHDLLPQGRITGWDPQWFEGFPLYVFYFPLPALFVAAFSVVFPYAVAFKLVTVLGPITLPVAAWAFGRLADFKRPMPALMAMATLPFLFNTSYTIEGGNLTSTLAGEFSYALALTSGLFFLGVFAYALRTGRLRWLAAALYGVTLLCHVVPALGYAAIAILLALSHWNRNTWRVLIPVGAVGALLAAFWLVPFAADLPYSSSMGYTRVTGVWSNIFPRDYIWMVFPAGLGAFIAIIRRDRTTIALVVATVAAVAGFQWLPAGFVYNGRWLPFYFLLTALLAAYGVAELFRLGGRWLELDVWQAPFVQATVGVTRASHLQVVHVLGMTVTAAGPLAGRLVRTITRSPRSVVLGHWRAGAPEGWRAVTFGGLRFSVPASWPVARSTVADRCPGSSPAGLTLQSATRATTGWTCGPWLGADEASDETARPGLTVSAGPRVGVARTDAPGTRCTDRAGLRICALPYVVGSDTARRGTKVDVGASSTDIPGALTAYVYIPGQRRPDEIELGLYGTGRQALEIYDSMRPAG